MYLNQIEAFVEVVDHKSFSKAAKVLYLSQPTISAYVKSLENEIGTQLIYRTTKDIILSEAGKRFYGYAKEMIRIRNIAISEMQEYTNKLSGNITIAATSFPSQYLLPKLIHEIMPKAPDVKYTLRQLDGSSVISYVESYNAELGITDFTESDCKCDFLPFAKDKLVLATPNTPEFQQYNGHFPLDMLTKYPFVWRNEGNCTGKETTAFLNSIGLTSDDLNIAIQMPSIESSKQSILNNIGISFISQRAISALLEGNQLLSFDLESEHLVRTLYAVTNKNRITSPATTFFINYLQEKYKNCPDC